MKASKIARLNRRRHLIHAYCARVGACDCRGLARCRAPATSGVFGRCRSLSTSPTWGNAGVLWRFELVRPAKPPRSCKRGSLALEAAHLNACFDSVGAGRRPRMNKRLKPADVQAINRKFVWWRGECGHVYQMAVRDRVKAKPGYCPYCSGRKRPEGPIRLD